MSAAAYPELAAISNNPLDLAEQLVMNRDWLFDRPVDEELVAEVQGIWCNYRIWFAWQEDLGALIFSCAYDTKIPEKSRTRVYPLLAAVNERMWLGHFDLGSEDGMVMFRHALLLRGDQKVTPEQIDDLLDIAQAECNRFYPAFQSVLWGGASITEALEIAMLDTVGEA